MVDYTESGVLTTASDLLFSGGREGHFFALDARNGELLWKVNLGGTIASGPMTFAVNGRQYVAVCADCADSAMYVFGLMDWTPVARRFSAAYRFAPLKAARYERFPGPYNTFPPSAPVCCSFSIVTSPFTITCLIPTGNWCGFSNVARSMTRS